MNMALLHEYPLTNQIENNYNCRQYTCKQKCKISAPVVERGQVHGHRHLD